MRTGIAFMGFPMMSGKSMCMVMIRLSFRSLCVVLIWLEMSWKRMSGYLLLLVAVMIGCYLLPSSLVLDLDLIADSDKPSRDGNQGSVLHRNFILQLNEDKI